MNKLTEHLGVKEIPSVSGPDLGWGQKAHAYLLSTALQLVIISPLMTALFANISVSLKWPQGQITAKRGPGHQVIGAFPSSPLGSGCITTGTTF